MKKKMFKLLGDSIYINAEYRRKILSKWVFFDKGTQNEIDGYYQSLLNKNYEGNNIDMIFWKNKLIFKNK